MEWKGGVSGWKTMALEFLGLLQRDWHFATDLNRGWNHKSCWGVPGTAAELATVHTRSTKPEISEEFCVFTGDFKLQSSFMALFSHHYCKNRGFPQVSIINSSWTLGFEDVSQQTKDYALPLNHVRWTIQWVVCAQVIPVICKLSPFLIYWSCHKKHYTFKL